MIKSSKTINWKEGINRLYIVFSLTYCVAAVVVGILNQKWLDMVLPGLTILPLSLYMIRKIVIWVYSGFENK